MDTRQESPWHDGERAIQRSIGAQERMEEIGRKVVRPYMPDQHRDFFAQLPFVVMGTVDETGAPWATLRTGAPGFMTSPESGTLRLALPAVPSDPAEAGLDDGAAVGLLGIELHTRRRNRVNGRLRRMAPGAYSLTVGESFGNCPQYIHLRDFEWVEEAPCAVTELAALDDRALALIAHAGTFFVASHADGAAGRKVDVSHRGGPAGFVRAAADGVLTVPDYAGNRFFNTLGNMLLNGRAGLLFVDFEHGHLLQMTGEVEVVLDGAAAARLAGAERLWRFRPRRIVWREKAIALRWRPRG